MQKSHSRQLGDVSCVCSLFGAVGAEVKFHSLASVNCVIELTDFILLELV